MYLLFQNKFKNKDKKTSAIILFYQGGFKNINNVAQVIIS